MNKLLLTLALATLTLSSAQAQGTIQFANTALSRVSFELTPGSGPVSLPTTVHAIFGVFWAAAITDEFRLVNGPLGTSSATSAGIISAPSVYPIAGTEPRQTVFILIRGWDANFGIDGWRSAYACSFYGQTDIRQVTLGETIGPGTVIWQTASGTNPNRFNPLRLGYVVGPIDPCPEPSTLALGALGGVALLLCWRKAAWKQQRAKS